MNKKTPQKIPSQMKAAVYRGQGIVRVEDIPVPAIKAGEVLIQVKSCGVCHTDLKKIKYDLLPPPRVFGHETAGVIARIGSGVSNWAVGDRVAVFHHVPCLRCPLCKRKNFAQCKGFQRTGVTAGFEAAGGGFAEYVRVLPWIVKKGMIRIPRKVSFDTASFLEPVNTCAKAVARLNPQKNETISVYGQGPIGLIFTQLIKERKSTVLGLDLLPNRRRMSLQLGAKVALDPRKASTQTSILRATEGRGVDAALLAVPSAHAVEHALKTIRPGGRLLLFAHTKRNDAVSIEAARICVDEITILGSYSASIDVQPKVERLIFSGKLNVAPLITHRFPLTQIQRAIERASKPSSNSFKVIINP